MSPPQRSLSWNLLSRLLLPYFLKLFSPSFLFSFHVFIVCLLLIFSKGSCPVSCLWLYPCLQEKCPANSANICFIDIFSVSTLYFNYGFSYYLYVHNIFLNINLVSTSNLDNRQMIFLWKFLPKENTYTYNIFLH